ncbi:MAG TPA: hypothetical protein EYG92_06075 [Lutibacter sp.]|nr:hypothetical protein [Lutibacter sp.]
MSSLLDFDLLELLKENGVVFNQKNEKEANNSIVHNNIPDNLIIQYEARIKEQQEIISLLKDKINYLET